MILVNSRRWQQFEPLVAALSPDLGRYFRASMRCWCGLEVRPYPLADWHVWIAEDDGRPVGVTGLYREVGAPETLGWIGWFGVLPEMRGSGFGTSILQLTEERAVGLGLDCIQVYTDTGAEGASGFYLSNGYSERRGPGQIGRQRSASAASMVLSKRLL
ncbi:GNAT family N-acetyltransferase [Brevundimonas sp.]|uniref:GNAT family N-acetyltransferase n=1 Tax=Brevundimonas sp. TaxID=1871086 RepID=UPI0034547299